jgi:DNA replication protein DnaC
MKRLWADLAAQSNREGWPAERLLHTLLGHEMAERETRRLARARADSGLPPGKSLAGFDFAAVPAVSKAHVMALAEADSWISQGHNLLAFGPPGTGKTHLVAGIGHALIDRGLKVLFVRTSELVQRLQAARRDLRLPTELAKLDRFDLIVLDDFSYARRDQAETSVLFELIAERYERKSLAITANAPFSAWDEVFPDKAMTVAAVDRLVHHSTILEMNVDSYRRRAAVPARRLRIARTRSSSSAEEGRSAGGMESIALTRSCTLSLYCEEGGMEYARLRIWRDDSAGNGCAPKHSVYRMQPSAQTSTLTSTA